MIEGLLKAQTADNIGEPDVFTLTVPTGTTEKCALLYGGAVSVAEQGATLEGRFESFALHAK